MNVRLTFVCELIDRRKMRVLIFVWPSGVYFRQLQEHRLITGYNTDVEYGGVVYHVQTEDKGVDHPIILSLVYVEGAILTSNRTPYDDLVTGDFDEAILTQRLQRQHKLICAAVQSGRIEELKRLGER